MRHGLDEVVTRTPLRLAENETLALDLRESRPSLETAPHARHPTFVNLLAADHLRVDVLQRVLSYAFLQNATICILVERLAAFGQRDRSNTTPPE